MVPLTSIVHAALLLGTMATAQEEIVEPPANILQARLLTHLHGSSSSSSGSSYSSSYRQEPSPPTPSPGFYSEHWCRKCRAYGCDQRSDRRILHHLTNGSSWCRTYIGRCNSLINCPGFGTSRNKKSPTPSPPSPDFDSDHWCRKCTTYGCGEGNNRRALHHLTSGNSWCRTYSERCNSLRDCPGFGTKRSPAPTMSPTPSPQSDPYMCNKCHGYECAGRNKGHQWCRKYCEPLVNCKGFGDEKHTTTQPTPEPTYHPTPVPATPKPSLPPTVAPSPNPTPESTRRPKVNPTPKPSRFPTHEPSGRPTEQPTARPTRSLTRKPRSRRPTMQPTAEATRHPTPEPSRRPTMTPTSKPTREPTRNPTTNPTRRPTKPPTRKPSRRPSPKPSRSPTRKPTKEKSSPVTCNRCRKQGCLRSGKRPEWCKVCYTLPNCPGFGGIPFGSDKRTLPPSPAPSPRCRSGRDCNSVDAQNEKEKPLSTGKTCSVNEQCMSKTCRNGACMASPDCYPIKHKFGTPFDKNKVNLVFVGSAFNSTTHKRWRDQVKQTYGAFGKYEMFSRTVEELNVFLVDPKDLNPSFCNYNCAGIDRLLCCDVATAQELSSKCFADGANLQTVVIHNDDKYGGAGYTFENIATCSTNSRGPEIAVHELGHSLFELADEYTYGTGTNESANCASTSSCDKWSDLIGNTPQGYNNVSCVPGCTLGEFYVGESSYMDVLSNPVGAVNTRFTCCTYQALTKTMPSYCDAFNFVNNSLIDYCKNKDFQKYGLSNYNPEPEEIPAESTPTTAKYVHVSQPLLVKVELQRGRKRDTVLLGEPEPGPSGLYKRAEVVGDFISQREARRKGFESVVKIKVYYLTGKETLYFSTKTVIDVIPQDVGVSIPADDEPRKVEGLADILNLALDTRGRTIRKIRGRVVRTSQK